MKRSEIINLAVEKGYPNNNGVPYTREQIERFRGSRWDNLVAWLGVDYTPAERSTSLSTSASSKAGLYIPMEIIEVLDIVPTVEGMLADIAEKINKGMGEIKPVFDCETGMIKVEVPALIKQLQSQAKELRKLLDRIKAVQSNA